MITTAPNALPAQTPPTDPLEFLGFRPGIPRAEVEDLVAHHGGRLACQTSRLDPRIAECRGSIHPGNEPVITIIVSMIHGGAAVTLLSAPVTDAQLRTWHGRLRSRYGPPAPSTAHSQQTAQWVRRNTMIRLTSRLDGSRQVASVSLVDGTLLDGLGPP